MLKSITGTQQASGGAVINYKFSRAESAVSGVRGIIDAGSGFFGDLVK